jgi:hypothetical protein
MQECTQVQDMAAYLLRKTGDQASADQLTAITAKYAFVL